MVTFQLSTEHFTATVQDDQPVHPDLLDELARRCVRLFVDAYTSLPDDDADPSD